MTFKGKMLYSSSHLSAESIPLLHSCSFQSWRGWWVYSMRRAETLASQGLLLLQKTAQFPSLPPTMWANGTQSSQPPEQQHCTIQFILYINNALKKKKRAKLIESCWGRRVGEEDNYFHSLSPKWVLTNELFGFEQLVQQDQVRTPT